ncbi:MAG: ATP-binding protein, partial [Actinomycetota bacterium]|nr:ATP-binding protein [Actinomycetota bacterium]
LGLPNASTQTADYTRPERIATAALRLVTRASLEILMRARGGSIFVDEAWTFLSHPQSLAVLDRLGREGRSQRVLPIFATQKLADITSKDLDSYISRVVVLQMETRKEAEAALTLCGVDDSEENLSFLRTAGSVAPSEDDEGRPSLAVHRDLYGRHSAMVVGPVPAWCPEIFSTNPEDRDALARKRARMAMAKTASAS